MAVLLLVAIATGAALFGITRFAIHYLFPFCLFAALALAGLAARRVDEERFAPRLAITSLAFALVIFLLKLQLLCPFRRHQRRRTCFPTTRWRKSSRDGLGKAQFMTLSRHAMQAISRSRLPEARAPP